jgi:hypothetical protein
VADEFAQRRFGLHNPALKPSATQPLGREVVSINIFDRFLVKEEICEGDRVVLAHAEECPRYSRALPNGDVDPDAPTECRRDFQKRLREYDAQRAARKP